jgi:hypothetical protein
LFIRGALSEWYRKFEKADSFSRPLPTQLPPHSYSSRAAERA